MSLWLTNPHCMPIRSPNNGWSEKPLSPRNIVGVNRLYSQATKYHHKSRGYILSSCIPIPHNWIPMISPRYPHDIPIESQRVKSQVSPVAPASQAVIAALQLTTFCDSLRPWGPWGPWGLWPEGYDIPMAMGVLTCFNG